MENQFMQISQFYADLPIEQKPESEWKVVLTKANRDFFAKLIRELRKDGAYVRYLSRKKRIIHNVYNTILNEVTWGKSKQKQWQTYIMEKYGSVANFNQFVDEKLTVIALIEDFGISFKDDPKFNLLVSDYDVYALTHKNICNQVEFICNLNDSNAKRLIFNYIKLNLRLDCIRGVKSDAKIYDIFIEEVSKGYHKQKMKPRIISNDPSEYCFTYIPLEYDYFGKIPCWQSFLKQFETKKMQEAFMGWVYSLIVANDCDRRVLWIEGKEETGKTTVVNVLNDFLSHFNPSLCGSLSRIEDKFSLGAVANCRLIIYSDARDEGFFKRKDVLNLTGGDTVFYEEKFKTPETKKLYGKIIVTSNYPPPVNLKLGFETSRLLHIKIDDEKADKVRKNRKLSGFAYRMALANEMPQFITKCKSYYKGV